MLSTAEKLFRDEVRDKKKGLSGVHSRTGKRGYVGKMKFPSDILKGSEKRAYKKNGKVVSWNMYEQIMEYNKFMELPEKEQKQVLKGLREKHVNEEIRKTWGLHRAAYYNVINNLGLNTRKISKNKNSLTLSEDEIKGYINNLITFEEFKNLILSQQYFLLSEYCKSMSLKELAENWNQTYSTVYNIKYKLDLKIKDGTLIPFKLGFDVVQEKLKEIDKEKERKEQEERLQGLLNSVKNNLSDSTENKDEKEIEREEDEPKSINVPSDVMEIEDLESNDETIPQDVHVPNEPKHKDSQPDRESAPARSYGTTLSFDGEYTQEQLRKKLATLVELLEEDGRYYKMNISFTEIHDL